MSKTWSTITAGIVGAAIGAGITHGLHRQGAGLDVGQRAMVVSLDPESQFVDTDGSRYHSVKSGITGLILGDTSDPRGVMLRFGPDDQEHIHRIARANLVPIRD